MPFAFSHGPLDLDNVVIETERLRLQAITGEFTTEIFRNFTPDITRFMLPAPPKEIAETEAFVEASMAGLARGDDLILIICRTESGDFLGVCGLHGRGRPGEPELGIWLRKAAHGQRYGREAIVALKAWADGHLEYDRLIYPVDRRNIPSRKIPEALGGKVIAERTEISAAGHELFEVVYAIDKSPEEAGPGGA